jgi:hypothetical protein
MEVEWEECSWRLHMTPHNEDFWEHFKDCKLHLEDKEEIEENFKPYWTGPDLHLGRLCNLFSFYFLTDMIYVIEYIKLDWIFSSAPWKSLETTLMKNTKITNLDWINYTQSSMNVTVVFCSGLCSEKHYWVIVLHKRHLSLISKSFCWMEQRKDLLYISLMIVSLGCNNSNST